MPAVVVYLDSVRRTPLPTVWEACETALLAAPRHPDSPAFRRAFDAVGSAVRRSVSDPTEDAGFLLLLAWDYAADDCWTEAFELLSMCRAIGVHLREMDDASHYFVTDDLEAAREEIGRAAAEASRRACGIG